MVRTHLIFGVSILLTPQEIKKNEIVLLLLLGEPKRHLKDFFLECVMLLMS